jgi:GDP-L-fucose synthase
MYYNLLQNNKRFEKLIHFGSGAETYLPSTPYGYSKKVIAKSILNQDNFYNIKIFGVFDENELDTRFIKANIKRYIAKEPMQINENKFMDFFYMQDLVKVIEYYIDEKEPPKEFDCVYEEGSPTLTQLSLMINDLDEHKVKIFVGNPDGDSYTSKYRSELPIEFIGLEEGIKQVYNKLK